MMVTEDDELNFGGLGRSKRILLLGRIWVPLGFFGVVIWAGWDSADWQEAWATSSFRLAFLVSMVGVMLLGLYLSRGALEDG